jgi:transcriptional regulator of acetoin/glycerol metabolism
VAGRPKPSTLARTATRATSISYNEGVQDEPPAPGLVTVFSAGRPLLAPVRLERGTVVLGRDDDRGIVDERLSRLHAVVSRDPQGRWRITDERSRNGTFVDGARVDGAVVSATARVVRLANTVYLLADDVRPFEGATVTTDADRVVGPAFARALVAAHAAADCVLVTGEPGVGKEQIAKDLHARRGGPFVAVSSAAIPRRMAERLLFGSARGAFADATDASGYLAAADGGVLFLDEVGDLDPVVQAKLLRVIETSAVVPLGSSTPIPVEARYCFATARDLPALVAESRFRADLYARIARTVVRVPPLRERREEISWLVHLEAARARRTAHVRLVEECLLRPWPGNVRELRGAIRAAAGAAGADLVVRLEHFTAEAGLPEAPDKPVRTVDADEPTGETGARRDVTREQIVDAMAAHSGNLTAVARALRLHRSQLDRLLDKYHVEL